MPYTFLFKKDKKANIVKKSLNVDYSKVYMDHLLGLNLFSDRVGFRFGFGVKCIVTSKMHVNFLIRYHIFMDEYRYIKFLDKNLVSTGLNFVCKF